LISKVFKEDMIKMIAMINDCAYVYCSNLFNKYFSSGSQEKARLISKYRLLIDRARRDSQTLLPLMFLTLSGLLP
jgi:hypothetical protein